MWSFFSYLILSDYQLSNGSKVLVFADHENSYVICVMTVVSTPDQ